MHPLRMTQGLRMLLLPPHLKYYASAIVEGRQLEDHIRCSYGSGLEVDYITSNPVLLAKHRHEVPANLQDKLQNGVFLCGPKWEAIWCICPVVSATQS